MRASACPSLTSVNARKGSLDSWLRELKRGATRRTEAAGIRSASPPPRARSYPWAVSDKDGRFVIPGVPGERLVRLGIRGETIAFHELAVVTRNMATITRQPTSFERWIDHLYGANFTCLRLPVGRYPVRSATRRPANRWRGFRIDSLVLPGRGLSVDGIIKC